MGARDEIVGLLHLYAERVDAGDFAGVGALFEGATYRADAAQGTNVFTDSRDLVRTMEKLVIRYEDGTPRTRHVVTNEIVEIDEGRGTASSRSYFTVLQAVPGSLPLQPVLAGRYLDRFERRGGAWRFADRLVLTDLVGDVRFHLRADPYRRDHG